MRFGCGARSRTVTVAAVAACCFAFGASAFADDGATLSQHYEPADGRVHIDVGVTYTGGGGSQYTPYYGVGTMRITLPQGIGVTLPSFAAPTPSEPEAIGCKVDTGGYDQAGTGFICSFKGQKQEAEILFPTTVTLHLVSTACYPFPDVASKQPARVDVWTAQDVTDGAPDATYAIGSSDPCAVPPPPVQNVAGAKSKAKTCKVPKLKKLTLKKATSKLKKAGCKRGKVTKVFSKTIKKGRVVRQSVKAKKKVKRGTKVKLKVSKGPEKSAKQKR